MSLVEPIYSDPSLHFSPYTYHIIFIITGLPDEATKQRSLAERARFELAKGFKAP